MPHSTSDVRIRKIEPLISPNELLGQLPITPAVESTVLRGRQEIEAILRGDDPRMLVVTGPCSIHDEQAAIEYATKLKALADRVRDRMLIVMRVYFEKPRTTIGWKGLIYDPHLDDSFDIHRGLYLARSILLQCGEMGLLTGTEFLDPIVPQYLADTVSWAAIGARTTESQTHRQMASGLSMPVGFKNGTDGNSQIAIDAMISSRSPHAFLGLDLAGRTCIVHTTGNPYGHLVLRGGTNGSNYSAKSVLDVQAKLENAGLPPRIMVDCSHANSEKDYRRQALAFRDVVAQRANGNKNLIGLMVESNLVAGNQKLEGDPSKLQYGVSITDACISWDETASLVTEAYQALPAPQPVG